MNKYVFNILYNLFSEVKKYKKYKNLDKIKSILNNEIQSSQCLSVAINESLSADSFYGLIVYPKISLDKDKEANIDSYVIELQPQLIDLLSPKELTALIIHDISHNVLSSTVSERLKLAVITACKMTNMQIVDILHNMDNKFRDLAILDISNRTYKTAILPDTEMYEPDRLLVDMDIWREFNSAVEKTSTLEHIDISNPESQNIADIYIGTKLIKMIREKLRGMENTYLELTEYIKMTYNTKVFDFYPSIVTQVDHERFGEKVSGVENLKPLELKFLHEGTERDILRQKTSQAAIILESAFGTGKISYSSLQKELDVINFKIDAVGSNYERLAVLDRIYDNIFSLEKYLTKHPDENIVMTFLKKFVELTVILKEAKVERKRYGVFVEVPSGYEG